MAARRKGQAVLDKKNQALERLAIEYVPVGSIHPNTYNPNRQTEHEFTMLVRSIAEDGFTQPVLVAQCDQEHECEGVIVDGEHRWRAVQALARLRAYAKAASKSLDDLTDIQWAEGMRGELPEGTDIAVVKMPMGEAQAKIATLRHNRARGSEDIELATDVLRDLERLGALEWAADSLDLSDSELQRLLEDIPAPEALAGEEFTEAWQPATGTDEGARGQVTPSLYADSTDAGADAARRNHERLAAAKTAQDRQEVLKSKDVFRLSLTFSGEEAEVVRAGLGDRPAVRILAWCTRSTTGEDAAS
jgi:ParB-like chromosome segregation protein Spo0J